MMPVFTYNTCTLYCREGIDWADIEWVDNAECLDLIEKVCACT